MILIASCPVDCGILHANFRRAVGLVVSLVEQTVGGDARHGAVKRRNPALIVGHEAHAASTPGRATGSDLYQPAYESHALSRAVSEPSVRLWEQQLYLPSHLHQIKYRTPTDQQHGDEDLPPCCCRLRYGRTLVKPPPTPTPILLETPLVMAAPLPNEAAPLTALL
jgi:hypothetical protein